MKQETYFEISGKPPALGESWGPSEGTFYPDDNFVLTVDGYFAFRGRRVECWNRAVELGATRNHKITPVRNFDNFLPWRLWYVRKNPHLAEKYLLPSEMA